MNFEEYSDFICSLASMPISKGKNIYDILKSLLVENKSMTESAINFRKGFVGEQEINIASAYLSTGLFIEYEENFRIACICVVLEAAYKKDIMSLEKDCNQYSPEQPLFIKEPRLLDYAKKGELIDYFVLNRIQDSEIFSFNNIYGYLNNWIPLSLLNWIDSNINKGESPFYIRVNPYKCYDVLPPRMISEVAIIPPNPKWWNKLTIYKGQHEGCSFKLNEGTPASKEYWEYNILRIRRLDVVAKRNGNGNLSMMIEELEEHYNMVDPGERYTIGRMIHLDTDAPINTLFVDAQLNHLDLAINIYKNEHSINRMNDNLAFGRTVENATFRTHILRIEKISFTYIFQFAYSFFKSQTLLNEWISYQFSEG